VARKAIVIKAQRRLAQQEQARALGKKMKHPTRVYNRCRLCGRIGGYMRFFQMCRICVRERVANGDVVGFKKASW